MCVGLEASAVSRELGGRTRVSVPLAMRVLLGGCKVGVTTHENIPPITITFSLILRALLSRPHGQAQDPPY